MKICGVILAGGKSSRMGTNKVFLKYGTQFLIDHMQDLLRKTLGPNAPLVISGPYIDRSAIADTHSGLGPLGGLYSVMTKLRSEAVLVEGFLIVPVDMPALTSQLLQCLLAHFPEETIFENHELPCLIKNTEENFLILEKILQMPSQERSLHNLLKKIGVTSLPCKEEAPFLNINTPQQWQQALKEMEIPL